MAKQMLALGLAVTWALTATSTVAQVKVIELTKPDETRDAAAVSRAVDGMSARVAQCVQEKLAPPQECSCRFPKERADLRSLYESTLRRHPDWRDQAVSYRSSSGGSETVSFPGLRRELEKNCPPTRSP
jgi:hypothetical protein